MIDADAAVTTTTFADRLASAVEQKRSQLVVGLDPVLDLLPLELRGDAHIGRPAAAEAFSRFCCGIVDSVAPYAVAVKPQLAFFEVLGSDGIAAFERVVGYARAAGLLVIVDGKRGDIGSTARAYADAYLEPAEGREPLADALTVNTYLGRDSLEPFVAACRRGGGGLFCLVKTSNAGSIDVQDLTLSDGRPLWQQVALLVQELGEELVGECGLSSIGAVVGATYPREVAEARKLLPQSILLLPGIGAQGGTPADIARAFTSGPASALVSSSRSVNYAFRDSDDDWRAAAAAEAARLQHEVWDSLRLVSRPALARLIGPVAFLLVATAAVLVVRAALRSAPAAPLTPPAVVVKHGASPRPKPVRAVAPPPVKQWYVIQEGDALGAIAERFRMSVAALEQLNPGIEPTALQPGVQIRVK